MRFHPHLEPLESRLTPTNAVPPPWLIEARGIVWQGQLPTVDEPITLPSAAIDRELASVQRLAAAQKTVDMDTAEAIAEIKAPLDPGAYARELRRVVQMQADAVYTAMLDTKALASRKFLVWYDGRTDGSTAQVQFRRKVAYQRFAAREVALAGMERQLVRALRVADDIQFASGMTAVLQRLRDRAEQLTSFSETAAAATEAAVLDGDIATVDVFYLDMVTLKAAAAALQSRLDDLDFFIARIM